MMPRDNETREFILQNPCPEWFWTLGDGLFWKEVEENFPIVMTAFVQERPEDYTTDVFSVKIKEMSRLARFQ